MTEKPNSEAHEALRQQNQTVLELRTPMITLWERILLVPLVGVIDTYRAERIMERLLTTVVETESQVVILDVTGVAVIDTSVAYHLMGTVSAAEMLGAHVIITGISPSTALTLAKLEIDLSGLHTAGALRKGVAAAFNLLGVQLAPRQEA